MQIPQSLDTIIAAIRPVNADWIEKARRRTAQLVMPPRALGRLHELAERCCVIQETLSPCIDNKAVAVMAGDHGIAAEGVSAFPQDITGAMVQTFLAGGAGINAVARHAGAQVWVVDMGIIPEIDPRVVPGGHHLKVSKLGRGTASFVHGPAMPPDLAEGAILTGFAHAAELFAAGVQVLGTGDMGIGNTTPSAAIGWVLTGCDIHDMVGRGTGVDDDGLARKKEVIARGVTLNRPERGNGLDVLAKVGGFEIGGIAGLVLAGAYYRRPVVIDGFISTAGALIAHSLCPTVSDYLFAGHRSEECGHGIMLQHLELNPILDLGMRLGEGTGAVLAMTFIQAAVSTFNEVMTFEQAGIGSDD